ncbi:predicted protein [Sclerotinia sclerotiorum 1980 UF-70]|uniref:Uncharacterized protein n=1 Tax=Sclerotinia sclerotiorum (strain ATCC 18683 / 1980 / Ss-1) TaxID=665079 RepID=A7EK94_SCLS1|nr:predicted protein [Sclerotinia sclerotiorum 1980 UF-70]EDO03260.1 predicted protein [Sclerotinia sclerotiorum 1980 UF-70]
MSKLALHYQCLWRGKKKKPRDETEDKCIDRDGERFASGESMIAT